MRESKTFGKRTDVLKSDETNIKYFLVFEGKKTELLYFDAINDLRDEININPLIELVPTIRSYSEKGWSNPQKIVDRMIKNLEENKTGYFSYETLCNWIIEFLYDEEIIKQTNYKRDYIWKLLKWICQDEIGSSFNLDVEDLKEGCTKILNILSKEIKIENLVKYIPNILKNGSITYDENVDKICFIVDRDRKSFVSKENNDQYKYVLNKCKEKGFGFYITNPCFEFWLLLHFDNVFELDKNLLLENLTINSEMNFTEKELRKLFRGYNKASYDAKYFVKRVDKAIKNEKEFCEDLEKLEYELGSNVGLLIEELRS